MRRALLRALLLGRPRRARGGRSPLGGLGRAPHAHLREVAELVDLFIAPARYLLERYRDEFGLPERKLVYLDYGFDLERLRGRRRVAGEPFTFGYIGTHIPAKGIHHLIEAFGRVRGDARLRIWGRPRGQDTDALRALADAARRRRGRVEWLPEYRNQDIVRDVLDRVDAIVVPSIWVENSPLVIHEAQQARVPVITADVGGMAEYVHHEVNGLLFAHRDPRGARGADAAPRRRPRRSPRRSARAATLHSTDGRRARPRGPRARDRALYRASSRGATRRASSTRGAVAHHLRHQPRHLQPEVRDVRGALAAQPPAAPSQA